MLAWILGPGLLAAGAVQWQAPEGCPEAAAVERRVEELLGRTPAEHELHAVGTVHAGPPWRLELRTTIGGRRQQRSLLGDDCRAVAEAAALILAVSVDPLGVDARTDGPREAEAPGIPVLPGAIEPLVEPPTPSPRLEPEPRPSVPPRPEPRARVRVRLAGGGEWGAIPGGTGGVRGGLALEGERAILRLEGSYWIDRLARLGDGSTRRGGLVGLGTVGVQGGVRLGGPRLRVPLVLGLEAGGLRARGVDVRDSQRITLPWLAGVVGAGVQWALRPRVALWGALEGVVPLVRLRVRVGRGADGSTVLHEPAVVGARALVGVSFKIARDT